MFKFFFKIFKKTEIDKIDTLIVGIDTLIRKKCTERDIAKGSDHIATIFKFEFSVYHILGKSPTGWVWHHDLEEGIMQLVPSVQHTKGSIFWDTLHPWGFGGFKLWGQ